MSTNLEAPVDRDLAACVADETVTRELVTEAMRKDGFMPALDWKKKAPPPKSNNWRARVNSDCNLYVDLNAAGKYWLYFSYSTGIHADCASDDEAKRTLLTMLLPRLKATVAQLEAIQYRIERQTPPTRPENESA